MTWWRFFAHQIILPKNAWGDHVVLEDSITFKMHNVLLGGGFKCFYFHPYWGKWSNLTNIFGMGWNHQLVLFQQTILRWFSVFRNPTHFLTSGKDLSRFPRLSMIGLSAPRWNTKDLSFCWLYGSVWGRWFSMFSMCCFEHLILISLQVERIQFVLLFFRLVETTPWFSKVGMPTEWVKNKWSLLKQPLVGKFWMITWVHTVSPCVNARAESSPHACFSTFL